LVNLKNKNLQIYFFLWHKYVNGDDNALELLKKYNSEDVIGLKILSNRAYGMLKERLVG